MSVHLTEARTHLNKKRTCRMSMPLEHITRKRRKKKSKQDRSNWGTSRGEPTYSSFTHPFFAFEKLDCISVDNHNFQSQKSLFFFSVQWLGRSPPRVYPFVHSLHSTFKFLFYHDNLQTIIENGGALLARMGHGGEGAEEGEREKTIKNETPV